MRMLCQSMCGRFNLLCALGGTTWGWHTSDSRLVYFAIVPSMLVYAAAAWSPWQSAAAWSPWLSAITISKLEKVQLEAARAITGLVRSTPVEVVLVESQLPSISARGVVPPTNASGCHNSSQMDFSQPSADTPLLLSSTLVGRTIVFGAPVS